MTDPVNQLGRFDLGFQEQIDFFRRKTNLGTQTWTDIWEAQHDRAFVVAGAMKADLLNEIRQSVDKAIATGTTLETFRKEFRDTTDRLGWPGKAGQGTTGGFNWRTKVIYETNLRTSYAAGREAQLADPGLQKLLPFRRYVHNDSVLNPRPQHLAWTGLTLPHDHPFWQTHSPPNGWGCRCRVTAVAAPKKGDATKPPAGWDDMDPETGAPPGIDKGWGYAPGASVRDELRALVDAKVEKLPAPLGKALAADVEKVLPRQAKSVAEASRIAKEIIDQQGAPWVELENGGGPMVRFSHVGAASRKDVIARRLGKADLSGLDVETANVVNKWLSGAQAEADRLGLPRLRGVTTASGAAGGSMGDGILAVSKTQRVSGKPFQPPSTYQLSDGNTGRPGSASRYFATNEECVVRMMWHEFGHHIHQTFKVDNVSRYYHPPLEARLSEIILDQKNRFGGLDFPTEYSKENCKEYFADVYCLHKMGRHDLVPSFMKDVIAKIENGEMP